MMPRHAKADNKITRLGTFLKHFVSLSHKHSSTAVVVETI